MDKLFSNIGSAHDIDLILSGQKGNEYFRERLLELYMLYMFSKRMNLSLHAEDFFEQSIGFIKDTLDIEDCSVLLLDEELGELKMWNSDSKADQESSAPSFKRGEGTIGRVMQTGEAVIIEDVTDEEWSVLYRRPDRNLAASLMCVPLKPAEGRSIGVLLMIRKEKEAFRNSERTLFSAVAENIAHTIERMKRYESLRKHAMFDHLTGLYTRRYFFENAHRELGRSSRSGEPFSVIMMDIDYFKNVNDRYGHPFGDYVLRKVADMLNASLRIGDIAARYGGEEFIIMLPDTLPESAHAVAEKLREMIAGDSFANENGVVAAITVTAGVASFPDDGETIEAVIASADRLLYAGKHSGRNRVVSTVKESSQSPLNDKRRYERYNVVLKIAKGRARQGILEMKAATGWRMCNIREISRGGLMIETEFEVKAGDVCTCRIAGLREEDRKDSFLAKVSHSKKAYSDRYILGAEVVEGQSAWDEFYTITTQ